MNFTFTEDQRDFAAAVADLLSNEAGPDQLRTAWENADGRLPRLWGQLVEMGVVGILAPEASGGLGMSDLDCVLLNYEAGRVGLSEPLPTVASVVIPTLSDAVSAGDAADGRAEELLASLVTGSSVAAVGLAPDSVVVGAGTADALVLQSGEELHLVDSGDVELRPHESLDGSRRVAAVAWEPSAATLLTADPTLVRRCFDRAAVASAAQLCGLAQTMLDLTVDYVGERKQFGVPIGSFQAIKHQLADALLQLEFAKPLVWRAAYSLSTGRAADDGVAFALDGHDASVHASMAKAEASDAATFVASRALQCHGAIAYTVEYDLHLYMKRAWALAASGGDAAWHRRRVADAILSPAG